MLRSKLRILDLCIFLILCSPLWTLAQQSNDPVVAQPLVYACINPDGGIPYLLTLRDADMSDHILGFLVPKRARVTIYSAESSVVVGVYSITPDAQSGGYRRTGMIAKASVRNDTPVSERPCSDQYSSLITPNIGSTIPLPVSPNQAVIVQIGGNNLLDTAVFLGVFAFHFSPESGEAREDIQLIQLSGGGIEVSFPYITEDTRLVIIANKEFQLRISFSQIPGDFEATALTNPTEGFAKSLERQKVGDPSTSLNLFQIMQEGAARIFPAFGVIQTYPTGGFLRLEMTPVAASRDPQFTAGQTLIALSDALELYDSAYAPTYDKPNGTPGTFNQGDKVKVVEVDSDGQLMVQSPRVGERTRVDAWLVQVDPSSQ